MKKIIFKFWIANILVGIVLFFSYRIYINETTSDGPNLFEKFVAILEILLNVWFSIAYILLMFVCSLPFFLNLIDGIRNNFYLSLLTFIGIPFIFVSCLMVRVMLDYYAYDDSVLTAFSLFSVAYLFFTTVQFLIFRKKIQNMNEFSKE